ncbi:Flp pilus assembly protein TadG [Mesorhizobium sp. USDA 4775]|uniref:TadE/TadG family type IV pilus assembly protein n=1 Tax=Mesorhizobium TaxID=68287 RepID=UPI00049B22AF|nr:TadE/TadG family type IV pilus assembly protein [Mesorhizobium jarvisii]AID29348.1 pilus assembly protein [Mesorhizobium huakuii 7653R]MCH4557751.1 pilus assembly protein [Mesorhizobium jarvisii]
MSRRRSFLRDKSGANAVEFALLSVPLLMVLMGTFEFGRMYWAQHVLNEIAAAGARCVGVLQSGCTQNGVYNAASAISYISSRAATDGIVLSNANIAVSNNTTCSGLSGFSSVQVSYNFTTVLPGFLTSLANGPNLSASACFPNQGA